MYALYLETKEQKYYDFAIRQADVFVEAAIENEGRIHWSDARDIVGDIISVSGSSKTGSC